MSNDSLPPELLQEVKDTVRRRVREDLKRVTDDVGALLEALDERLFDPDLTVRDLSEGARDPETFFRFRLQLGLDIEAYRDQRRLEAAHELAVRCDARVGEIALSLGFPEAEIFSKWFKRRTGRSPEKLRASHREKNRGADPPSRGGEERVHSDETDRELTFHDWQRALVEVLESGRLDELIRFGVDRYPDVASEIPALHSAVRFDPEDLRARRRR